MAIRMWTKEQSEPLIKMMEKEMPAFFHMERSIKCGRPLILSDGEECLLAQDSPADPMWIWTSDNISDVVLEDMIFSLSALKESKNLRAVVAKNRTARLLSLAFDHDLKKKQRLSVYTMNTLQPKGAEGECVPGTKVDPDTAGEMIALMLKEDGEDISPAKRNSMGAGFSQSPDSFAWKTGTNEIATIAKTANVGSLYTEIHTVVTKPEMRNCGYAQALLTAICKRILAEGRTPLLYADRDYLPSNAAYRKIGFLEKDRLTVLRLRNS